MIPPLLGTSSIFSQGHGTDGQSTGLAALFSQLVAGHTQGEAGDVSSFLSRDHTDVLPSEEMLAVEKAMADFLRGIDTGESGEALFERLDLLQKTLSDAGVIDAGEQQTSFEIVSLSFVVVGADDIDTAMAAVASALDQLSLSFDAFDEMSVHMYNVPASTAFMDKLAVEHFPTQPEYAKNAFAFVDNLPTHDKATVAALSLSYQQVLREACGGIHT